MVWDSIGPGIPATKVRLFVLLGLFVLVSSVICLSQSVIQPVRLDSIIVLNEFGHPERLAPQSEIRLKARQNYLTFRFKANEPTVIQYKLDGLDNDWMKGMSTEQIRYANLSGGDYTFQMRDLATGHTETVGIQLDVPLWKQWWFVPVVFLYLIGVISLVFYLFLQYRLRQQLRLLSVRENIARDLHDDMGSYLGSISVLSQSVLNVAQQDPQRARLLVDKIGETARLVMDSMSDIVWAINPENDSMDQIIVRMRDVANDLLGSQDIAFYQTIDDAVATVHLPLEKRRDFFLIYKEALTNIAKYAQAHQVWIRLQRNELGLVLNIHDDGVGFDPHQSAGQDPLGGNGLKNMRVRAEKLGGMFTIQSAPGQGTRLTLQISVT